ncbi:glycosyltransferase family 2 protein [Georgenia muralis]|uniref:GT2 family glycosyltransferase n=1 Tax=Georgenia muralis TaxID=154117 RepID=A0A3N4YXL0_9MICO|nr:glycosyltransferase [Georgenia muralis]RPF25909.1 GT2 family glycosyltransferase [Georgenia muralis]
MSPALCLVVAVPTSPSGDTDGRLLEATLASFVAQGEGSWEVLTVEVPADPSPLGAAALTHAATTTTAAYVALVEAGDRLEPGALSAVLEGVGDRRPGLLYTDEQWPAQGAAGIFTKPDWMPRYLEALPYPGRLTFFRRDVLLDAGAWRHEHGPAFEWDTLLRVTELTDDVVHVPVLGVSRHRPPELASLLESGRDAVAARFRRLDVPATVEVVRSGDQGFLRVWRDVPDPPLVTLVIPTAGGRRKVRGEDVVLVTNALRALLERTSYPRWEVVLVVSDGTPAETIRESTALLGDRLAAVVPVSGPFNFSRSVNSGAAAARGDFVLALNDDTEVIEPRWLDRMVAVAQDPDVGAVGAKLLFEDGRIQHAGIVFANDGRPLHVHIFESDADAGHFGSKVVDLDYLAVTGACLLVRRSLYETVGGFTEDLPLNFNDVDFCLKLVATGHRVVCTPYARLHHYESSTRHAEVRDFELEALAWWRPWTLADPHVNVRGIV